jgi:Zn-finger protein
MDGQLFHRITGSQIGDSNVWATLCHDPLYFILNVAVGGNWVRFKDLLTILHLSECVEGESADVKYLQPL